MRNAALQQVISFSLDVVFDPACCELFTVDDQIGSACVTVVRLADAACVGDGPSFEIADERYMDVRIHDRLGFQRRVHFAEFNLSGVWRGSSPIVAGACVNKREARLNISRG
jgi:hypothetical protein